MIDFISGLRAGILPVKKTTVDVWADENRFLTSVSSAEPGRWRTDRVPFLRQIMEDLSPRSGVIEIIVQKGVQLGFTESALNTVGCYIDYAPAPIMYVMPTVEMAKVISKDRLTPMIDNCPSLQGKVKPARSRDADNTTLAKSFPGGRVSLTGANSGAALRSKPVRVLILDEVDAYPADVDGEGSPVSLAKKRTSTFGSKRKIFMPSTPLIKGASTVEAELLTTEVNKFYVPCPFCGEMQHLIFSRLSWDEANPGSTTKYLCIGCNTPIEERYKTFMLAGGVWYPTIPENINPQKRGYHINSLYSPLGWLSWSEIAKEWITSQGKNNKLQAFVNTILGETWAEPSEAPPWESLYNRRETYTLESIPDSVTLVVCGCDVQRDRIHYEIVGYSAGMVSYSLDYRILVGDTSGTQVWDQLSEVLTQTFRRADGAILPIRMLAIDSGYNTQTVYRFVSKYDPSRVIPIKGDAELMTAIGAPKPVDINQAGKSIGSVKVWRVGVGMLKSELYGWFRLPQNTDGTDPPGYCHFREYGQEYFKEITAESIRVFVDKKGHPKTEWFLPGGHRNEALDCRVYARAAAYVCGMDHWSPEQWERIRMSYHRPKIKSPPSNQNTSSYWDR